MAQLVTTQPTTAPNDEAQSRVQQCEKELSAVLAKYNCWLNVSVLIKNNQIIPFVEIEPKE